ncbi:hypothetical protein LM602_04015 [Candidatus Acetothermia bacterium]|jgi:hypothetical protein|nr:hypothetical protein [Candidatus Acetothermia bacterium]MCI2431707.1 hypothetical protein [Candidatus Acetothermia bacterium]MCI2436697.1 hypothetical protein [Candidatus Acetothermia bacterium]
MRKWLVLSAVVVLSAVSVLAQETGRPLFEPASGTFYLDFSDLNALLRANDFAPLATPIFLTGGWTRFALWGLSMGMTIAEGATGAERASKRAHLTLFYFSLFTDDRRALSEAVPYLQGFISGGLGVGTATLLLEQRAADERTLEAAIQNPHDTLLRRTFFSLVPRAGIEFSVADIITARLSLGYIWSFWSGPWERFAEKISGPPKSFDGFLIEFTFAYRPRKEADTDSRFR